MGRQLGKQETARAINGASGAKPFSKARLWPALGVRTHLVVVLAVGLVVGLTYSSAFLAAKYPGGFALDNKFIILEDPRLRGATEENVRLIFTQDYWWPKGVGGLYRPLTTLSYMFNYTVLGNKDHAMGYVIINVLLHWANATLVYFLALILLENFWLAAFTAALFAVHPLGTEAVTNIVGRADEFATLSVLGGFLLYVKSTTVTGSRKMPWLGGLMATTALGVFCKESAVVVVGAVAAYDFVYRLQPKRSKWLSNLVSNFWGFFRTGYIWFVPPLAVWARVRAGVFANLTPAEWPFVDNPLVEPWERAFRGGHSVLSFATQFWDTTIAQGPVAAFRQLGDSVAIMIPAWLTAIKALGRYLWLLLWPQSLSCDYSYNQIPLVTWRFNHWSDWQSLVALVTVVVMIVIAVRQYHRNKAICFLILLFFVAFLPSSNLLVVFGSIMAERLMYLPMIGCAGCAVVAIYSAARRLAPRLHGWLQPERGRLVTVFHLRSVPQTTAVLTWTALCGLVCLYGARTFVRDFDWRDDIALWTSAIRVCPKSFKTHKSLAYALYEKDGPEYKNIDRILHEAEEAVRITESTSISNRASIVYLHLGTYYRLKGDRSLQRIDASSFAVSPQSAEYYRKAVEALLWAVSSDQQFNKMQREKDLRRGRRLEEIRDTGNQEIYLHLGLTYMRLSQYDNALQALFYMRHLVPNNPEAYLNIGRLYLAMQQKENAAIALLQGCLVDSSRTDIWSQLMDLYKDLDRDNCAVVVTDGKPRLNFDCPIVRRHVCAAHLDLMHVFIEAKQEAVARQIKEEVTKNYPCEPEEFNRLLR
jgi:tetratricopeptide (TPR) repeat protein